MVGSMLGMLAADVKMYNGLFPDNQRDDAPRTRSHFAHFLVSPVSPSWSEVKAAIEACFGPVTMLYKDAVEPGCLGIAAVLAVLERMVIGSEETAGAARMTAFHLSNGIHAAAKEEKDRRTRGDSATPAARKPVVHAGPSLGTLDLPPPLGGALFRLGSSQQPTPPQPILEDVIFEDPYKDDRAGGPADSQDADGEPGLREFARSPSPSREPALRDDKEESPAQQQQEEQEQAREPSAMPSLPRPRKGKSRAVIVDSEDEDNDRSFVEPLQSRRGSRRTAGAGNGGDSELSELSASPEIAGGASESSGDDSDDDFAPGRSQQVQAQAAVQPRVPAASNAEAGPSAVTPAKRTADAPETSAPTKKNKSLSPPLAWDGTLRTIGNAQSVHFLRRVLSLPSTIDIAPPCTFTVPRDLNLAFKRQPNHIGSAAMDLYNQGRGGVKYERSRNGIFPTGSPNLCSIADENVAPGQPIMLCGYRARLEEINDAISPCGNGKAIPGINVFIRTKVKDGPLKGTRWTYCGWYETVHIGVIPLPAGPGAFAALDPAVKNMFRGLTDPVLSCATPEKVRDRLEDWGFEARNQRAALAELEDPSRVGHLVLRYLLLRCVDFDEASFKIWAHYRGEGKGRPPAAAGKKAAKAKMART
ncbi:hypothetical protein JCM10449v2_007131 [Rhodotorula kratochvilovae]